MGISNHVSPLKMDQYSCIQKRNTPLKSSLGPSHETAPLKWTNLPLYKNIKCPIRVSFGGISQNCSLKKDQCTCIEKCENLSLKDTFCGREFFLDVSECTNVQCKMNILYWIVHIQQLFCPKVTSLRFYICKGPMVDI